VEIAIMDTRAVFLAILSVKEFWKLVNIRWSFDGKTTLTTILRPFFPGPPRWAGARRELLDFMVQGKINRGRHPGHPDGRHSIRSNQCPPPPSRP